MSAIGRNEPCHCGSGKKYKRCCALKANQTSLTSRIAISLIALMLIAGAIFMISSLGDRNEGEAIRVWHGDHWDYPGQGH